MSEYTHDLITGLEALSNPSEAAGMKRYMRDLFDYYGIKKPVRAVYMRDFYKTHGLPSAEEWLPIVSELWNDPHRECQYIAQEMVRKCYKYWDVSDLPFFENLVTTKSWWDTVDFIASNVIGRYFQKFPDNIHSYVRRMNASQNTWLIRVSILFQLKYKDQTDEALLFEMIMPHLGSNQFFIQKAIGWSLRQYAKFQPDSVLRFVENRPLKPLSRREALKHF
jgi:3-methyladenine DNA glycosylase AlkD